MSFFHGSGSHDFPVGSSAAWLPYLCANRNRAGSITLAGGATQTETTSDIYFSGSPRLSVAGGISFGTLYKLDGADHFNFQTGVSMPMPFPDALQEFKVETSGLSAQAGESTKENQYKRAWLAGDNILI